MAKVFFNKVTIHRQTYKQMTVAICFQRWNSVVSARFVFIYIFILY